RQVCLPEDGRGSACTGSSPFSPDGIFNCLSVQQMPVKIFCSYAHKDKARAAELRALMRRLTDRNLVELFIDDDLRFGTRWEPELYRQIDSSEIVLLLVS